MKIPLLSSLKNSIVKKLFTVVFPAYLAVASVIALVHFWVAYQSIRMTIAEQMDYLQDMVEPRLIEAFKQYDIASVKRQLKGLVRNPYLIGVKIDAPITSEPFLSVGYTKKGNTDQLAYTDPNTEQSTRAMTVLGGVMERSRQLSYFNETGATVNVGTLILYSSNQAILGVALPSFILIFLTVALMAIALWVIFLWGSYAYVSAPLATLISTVQKIAKGEITADRGKIDVKKNEGTDVDILTIAFNTMLDKVTRSNAELLSARNRLSGIIRAMPSALISVTGDHIVTDWNERAEQLTGVLAEKAIGEPLAQVYPHFTQYMGKLTVAISEGKTQEERKKIETIDDEPHYFNVLIYPVRDRGAVIRIDDVTAQVKMEEIMVQTEKMTSIGVLAAGVAHEINNPLGTILQGTQNILRRIDPKMPVNVKAAEEVGVDLTKMHLYLEQRQVLEFLKGVSDSGVRAADIVSNLLQFSRKSTQDNTKASFSEIIERSLDLVKTDYHLKKKIDFKQIEIVKDYDPNLPPVYCSVTEVEQVMLNVLKNASQAMHTAGTSDPKIIIRLHPVAEGVRLEVEDNGPGMPEKVRKRIFEPFFTTKPVGEGTGLGLSVSYNLIVENNKGRMTVESVEGKGTKFIIVLPKPE